MLSRRCVYPSLSSELKSQEESGGVVLSLDLGNGKIFSLSGVPGRGPFSVSTVHPFLLDGLFVENLEEIQAQARRIQVGVCHRRVVSETDFFFNYYTRWREVEHSILILLVDLLLNKNTGCMTCLPSTSRTIAITFHICFKSTPILFRFDHE